MARSDKTESKLIGARLAALRRAKRPKQLLNALEAVDAETESLKVGQLPELLRMIRVLYKLQDLIEVHGIARFFMEWPEPIGAYAPDAVAWCRTLGAERAATYLDRALALFPDGRAPADGAAAQLAVEKIEEEAPTAFLDLDREFKGVEAEIPTLLQRYLLVHEAEVSLALSRGLAAVRSAETLPAILATREPLEFLERLIDLVAPESGAARMAAWSSPEPSATTMLQVLYGFYLDVGAEGIAKFLSSPLFGGLTMKAARWCRAMGAERSAQYFDAAAALFPGRQIPASDEERCDIVERLIDDHNGQGPDPLRQLDKRYRSAPDEMVRALREYLEDHSQAPLASLEALARS